MGTLPIANFKPRDTSLVTQTLPTSIQFTNLSEGIISEASTTYTWTVTGEANMSYTTKSPLITFDEYGNYNITMSIDNTFGTDSLSITNAVKITNLTGAKVLTESVCVEDSNVDAFSVPTFEEICEIIDETLGVPVLHEAVAIIQKYLPDKPGFDEFGQRLLYDQVNQFGQRLLSRVTGFGHRIIRAASNLNKTGFATVDMIELEEKVLVTDYSEFDPNTEE